MVSVYFMEPSLNSKPCFFNFFFFWVCEIVAGLEMPEDFRELKVRRI